jgi:hypothetical protein
VIRRFGCLGALAQVWMAGGVSWYFLFVWVITLPGRVLISQLAMISRMLDLRTSTASDKDVTCPCDDCNLPMRLPMYSLVVY